MRNALLIALPALALIVLSGCETTPVKEEAAEVPVEERDAAAEDAARTRGIESATGFQGHPLDDPNSPLSKQVIYFDFDSAEILDAHRFVIEAHAAYMAENPGSAVTLEGHTDERGSREYNLGLGERRSQSVRRMLVLLGAQGGQLQTVSYGEEKPEVDGHDESAWKYNRRVVLVYRER